MSLFQKLWNALRPGRIQRDLDREIAFHLAERAEDLRGGGMDEAGAHREARLRFGNVTLQTERTRDMNIDLFLDSAIRNLRLAFRSLAKTPVFTATVVLTLAIAIGANSAVFSAIDAVLLRPLAYPRADRLTRILQAHPKIPDSVVAPARLADWDRLNDTFQGMTGYYLEPISELSGELPEKLIRAWVAPRFLEVMGVAPLYGRALTKTEERFGGPNTVLLSEAFWRRRFAGDRSAVGKAIRVGGASLTVVGVMPASFQFPSSEVDLFTVSPFDAPYAQNRANTWFTVIGRMKAGVSLAEAQSNLAAIQENLGRQYPQTDSQLRPAVEALKSSKVGGVAKSLWILFGAVTLLLLLACTNVAALLLARAAGRRHEVSLRYSLGASRASVAAQWLTEVFVLALAGASLGLLCASLSNGIFTFLSKDLPRVEEIALDWRIVLYSLGAAVAVTFVCGILPLIRVTRTDLAGGLAQAGRSQISGRNRVQLTLAAVQLALAVTLLTGAGLLIRSIHELNNVSPGFDAARVLSFQVSSGWGETVDQKASRQRVARILESLRSLPGVEDASVSMKLPGLPSDYPVEVQSPEGRAAGAGNKMIAQPLSVSPSYFATMGIPLLNGELCRGDETSMTVMVNRTFATNYLTGSSVVGRHLSLAGNGPGRLAEIRGVVGDSRETGLDRQPAPAVYWCYSALQPGMWFLARTSADPASMSETIRRKIHELEPNRSVYEFAPLASRISDGYAENRLRTVLLTFFALTAISLAGLGVYGTLSYLVRMRRREVALRMALGAARGEVMFGFVSQGLIVAALGAIAGLAIAAGLGRFIAGMLYGVSALDPITLASVATFVLIVSALASLIPAIHAARLEPMKVLREE